MDRRNFDVRQLETFAAVMSTGSITGAARLTGQSQPTVTRLVRELEAEIGFSLLHRAGPRITPTANGISFHQEVERALMSVDQMRAQVEAIVQAEAAPLATAATPALAGGIVPAALARLAKTLPNKVQLDSAPAEVVVQSVLSGRAAIGLTSLPFDHPGLTTHWVGHAACVALLAADDPLAALPVLPLAELATRRLLTMANPFRLRGRVQAALERQGITPPAQLATNTTMNAALLVRAGLGIAVVEPATAYGAPIEGVVVRPLDVEIPFLWGVVTPARQPCSAMVASVIDAVYESAVELLPGFRLCDPTERAALAEAEPTLEYGV
jgi:DNA-binding transcriptional LysR family regulator